MTTLVQVPKRQVFVPNRDTELSPDARETQIQKGLYTTQRGERLAIPVDSLKERETFLDRQLWDRDSVNGTYRQGVKFRPREFQFQKKALAWLRDNVNDQIPYWYYMLTLGHDLHVSTYANLFATHWHVGWANPFDPELIEGPLDVDNDLSISSGITSSMRGFVENCGWLSGGKVTTAFVSEEIDELVSATSTEYADFDFHEVGTNNAAEANTQTALSTTSGIARVTGSPTDADPIYRNVGTITADATETWQEHGLFNNSSGAAMMDRSLTGGQSVNSSDQVQYTYELTKNAES